MVKDDEIVGSDGARPTGSSSSTTSHSQCHRRASTTGLFHSTGTPSPDMPPRRHQTSERACVCVSVSVCVCVTDSTGEANEPRALKALQTDSSVERTPPPARRRMGRARIQSKSKKQTVHALCGRRERGKALEEEEKEGAVRVRERERERGPAKVGCV